MLLRQYSFDFACFHVVSHLIITCNESSTVCLQKQFSGSVWNTKVTDLLNRKDVKSFQLELKNWRNVLCSHDNFNYLLNKNKYLFTQNRHSCCTEIRDKLEQNR